MTHLADSSSGLKNKNVASGMAEPAIVFVFYFKQYDKIWTILPLSIWVLMVATVAGSFRVNSNDPKAANLHLSLFTDR